MKRGKGFSQKTFRFFQAQKKAAMKAAFLWFRRTRMSVAKPYMAQWTGLEPATPGVTGRYSNRLNYHCASVDFRPVPLTELRKDDGG